MTNTSTPQRELCQTRLLTIALLIGLLALVSLSAVGQRVITTLTDGNSTFTYFNGTVDLNALISAATANDTILLPGGPIDFNSTIVVDKPLVFIGAGYAQAGCPVTQETYLLPPNGIYAMFTTLHIAATGSGSSFHGIYIDRNVEHESGVDGIFYTRCRFGYAFRLGMAGSFSTPSATNITIRECVFKEGITMGNSSTSAIGLSVFNSILEGGLNAGPGFSSGTLDHCILLNPGLNGAVNNGVSYNSCVITDVDASLAIIEQACFNSCLFVLGGNGTVTPNSCWTGNGNEWVSNTPPAFINVLDLGQYVITDDHHLSLGSIGIDMGAGIYGGQTPFKADGVPFNPHWTALNVPSLTQGGLLAPVTIGGEAQSY